MSLRRRKHMQVARAGGEGDIGGMVSNHGSTKQAIIDCN